MSDATSLAESYVKRILSANIYDLAVETPVTYAQGLSQRFNNNIWIKREDLQPVYSFKIRGAYNCLLNLSAQQKAKGVIAASAGNHAQGLAMAAHHLGINATIVMPKTTPAIKVDAVARMGATVLLHGDNFPEALVHSNALKVSQNLTYIHPFDDKDIIAGQGTVAVELMRQIKNLDAVFVPVGGGGLISGMAVYIKYLNPHTKVIGVEPADAASLSRTRDQGERVRLDTVGLFADGVAVAEIGQNNFAIAGSNQFVDAVVTVTTDEICAAIKDIYDDTRAIAEPAGACALAGMKAYLNAQLKPVDTDPAQSSWRDKNIAVVASGANVNFDRLRHVAERAELGERREAIIAAQIDERPGSFKAFCVAIGKRSVTEFNYRYADTKHAQVFVGVQMESDPNAKRDFLQSIAGKGINVVDLSDNEVAKIHTRYMVGGRANVTDEVIYRFIFPERPGALLDFLQFVGKHNWNITLFHYRNHGSAYGRVLVGMQVPPSQSDAFTQFLQQVGYDYYEETHNPAYQLFLNRP